jgi:hypothetical protein
MAALTALWSAGVKADSKVEKMDNNLAGNLVANSAPWMASNLAESRASLRDADWDDSRVVMKAV